MHTENKINKYKSIYNESNNHLSYPSSFLFQIPKGRQQNLRMFI